MNVNKEVSVTFYFGYILCVHLNLKNNTDITFSDYIAKFLKPDMAKFIPFCLKNDLLS